mmetsp:Transcript_11057/g.28345  ORF Transcript_11057/g.28345 Transcript_11057/m.28345 type:complete len:356 (-) Transcript_11057:368-1435(-)
MGVGRAPLPPSPPTELPGGIIHYSHSAAAAASLGVLRVQLGGELPEKGGRPAALLRVQRRVDRVAGQPLDALLLAKGAQVGGVDLEEHEVGVRGGKAHKVGVLPVARLAPRRKIVDDERLAARGGLLHPLVKLLGGVRLVHVEQLRAVPPLLLRHQRGAAAAAGLAVLARRRPARRVGVQRRRQHAAGGVAPAGARDDVGGEAAHVEALHREAAQHRRARPPGGAVGQRRVAQLRIRLRHHVHARHATEPVLAHLAHVDTRRHIRQRRLVNLRQAATRLARLGGGLKRSDSANAAQASHRRGGGGLGIARPAGRDAARRRRLAAAAGGGEDGPERGGGGPARRRRHHHRAHAWPA